MGLEVETATKFPHKLQREKKRKKRKDKKKVYLFCSQPRQQMTKTWILVVRITCIPCM